MLQNIKKIFFPLGDRSQEELQEEFKKFYEIHADFVRTVIYWTVRSDSTDDLVQETFLKAWKSYKGFEQRSQFKTWIYRTAVNTCYDFLNERKKNNEVELEDVAQGGSSSPELQDLISKGLSTLSEKHREVFILFYKLELSLSEIAEFLALAEGTVKSRLHYAKDNFLQFLKDNGVDNG